MKKPAELVRGPRDEATDVATKKPAVFVGSSTEGLRLAGAIRRHLVEHAEVTLWNEDFFDIGTTFIETLVNAVSRFDFAVLILTPDDMVESRSDTTLGPRDNVLFEAGLFMGRLGRDRTFIVHQAGPALKIPTDLAGLTTAKYYPRADQNAMQEVGPASNIIQEAIRNRGFSRERTSQRIQQVAQEQQRQADEIGWIKLLLELVLPTYERQHLQGLSAKGAHFWVNLHEDHSAFEWELRHLLNVGLVERQPDMRLGDLFKKEGRQNLKAWLKIADRGKEYMKAYDEMTKRSATKSLDSELMCNEQCA